MSSLYVGCDVGAKGGICVLDFDREIVQLSTIPKVKTSVDYKALSDLIKDLGNPRETFVCIEDVHSIYGMSAKSNFNFGYIKGFMVSCIINNNYTYELVHAKVWQKEIWTNADKVKKTNNKTDTKGTSLLAAKRLFPDESFLATSRSSKPHDGLYDAALIAEYCRRKFY